MEFDPALTQQPKRLREYVDAFVFLLQEKSAENVCVINGREVLPNCDILGCSSKELYNLTIKVTRSASFDLYAPSTPARDASGRLDVSPSFRSVRLLSKKPRHLIRIEVISKEPERCGRPT